MARRDSPLGVALRARDQPRRMAAWAETVADRWITFVYAGFWGAVSGLLFVYHHKYIHRSRCPSPIRRKGCSR
jgi:branched-chain amino acid transport system permease protein